MKPPILVIDDEPAMLASLRRLLRHDFEVFTAGSGAEGLALMQQQEIHVVLTDQRMPGMTGVDFLSQVKGQHPDAVRMLFTGYADMESVVQAINAGNIYRYLTKPWNPDDLLATVREASERYDLTVSRRQLLDELQLANALLEQRVLERTVELTSANENLGRLSRLKDEFLAVVSHDLRTPLAGILGALELLQEGIWDDPVLRLDMVRVIRSSAERMQQLVSDLLDLARIEAGKLSLNVMQVCVSELLDESLAALRPAAQVKGIACRLEIGDAIPDIAADPARLYQVFNNLIGNAIKFTASGGAVLVTCQAEGPEHVRIAVRDTGRGMTPQDLARLFRRFEQTSSQSTGGERGSGLGLYISKQFVELHQGHIEVTSEKGVGSTFAVILPLDQA